MYCRYCGKEVGSEQRHCTKCGSKQPSMLVATESQPLKNNGLSIITKIFVAICLILMLTAGLQMLRDDNYLGLTVVILGFGIVIYGLLWWQNKQVARFQMSQPNSVKRLDFEGEKLLASEGEKLLASGDEPISVIEEITRKLETVKVPRKQ